jgi:DNA adenine methylase
MVSGKVSIHHFLIVYLSCNNNDFFMRYTGSKKKFAKDITAIIEQELKPGSYYVEPFMGGGNIFSVVDHPLKIGADANEYIIAMWQFFQRGGVIPMEIPKSLYYEIKENPIMYPKYMVGYVASACSYGGGWWKGYANYNPNKNENHIREAYNGLRKQLSEFKYFAESKFCCSSYEELKYPPKSVIYCDPPYQSATSEHYKNEKNFDFDYFWEWCRKMKKDGHTVFISEYDAPGDFECVWEKEKKDGMSTTKSGEKQKTKVEKLFM